MEFIRPKARTRIVKMPGLPEVNCRSSGSSRVVIATVNPPLRPSRGQNFPVSNFPLGRYKPPAPVHKQPAPVHQPQAPVRKPQAPLHQHPATVHQPSSPIYNPLNRVHQPTAPVHHPSSPTYHPLTRIHQPPAPVHHPPARVHQPPARVHQPSPLIHHPQTRVYQPSTPIYDPPTPVSLPPSPWRQSHRRSACTSPIPVPPQSPCSEKCDDIRRLEGEMQVMTKQLDMLVNFFINQNGHSPHPSNSTSTTTTTTRPLESRCENDYSVADISVATHDYFIRNNII